MKTNIKLICISAVFMALVFAVTRFIQIPIPLGYFNVGNCVILLACLFVPLPYGLAIGGLASALADLTSYPVYTIPTLIIKILMPLVFYIICKAGKNNRYWLTIIAAAVATLIPLFGYTFTGGIIYGNMLTGLAQFPGLALEYAANLIIFAALLKPMQSLVRRLTL